MPLRKREYVLVRINGESFRIEVLLAVFECGDFECEVGGVRWIEWKEASFGSAEDRILKDRALSGCPVCFRSFIFFPCVSLYFCVFSVCLRAFFAKPQVCIGCVLPVSRVCQAVFFTQCMASSEW